MKGFTVLGKGRDIMKRFDISTIFSVSVLIVLIVAGCAEIHRPSLDADSYVKRGLPMLIKANMTRTSLITSRP